MGTKAYMAKYYRDRIPEMREKNRLYYEAHKDIFRVASKERAAKRRALYPETLRAYKRERLRGPIEGPKACARAVMRKLAKSKATPAWANRFFIEEAYALARLRSKVLGYKWHVDHIVPIKSEIVCGLHVENNLRVIPAIINLKKGNKFLTEFSNWSPSCV